VAVSQDGIEQSHNEYVKKYRGKCGACVYCVMQFTSGEGFRFDCEKRNLTGISETSKRCKFYVREDYL